MSSSKPRGVSRARNGETVVVPTRLRDLDRQIRRLSKERKAREATETFTDVPLDWALDAAKKLPTDNEKMAAASALRRRARAKFHDGGDEDQIIAIQAVADAIEGLCSPLHPPGTVVISPTTEEYTAAEQRYGLIRRQIDAVCPDDDEMSEAAEWILEGNIKHFAAYPTPATPTRLFCGGWRVSTLSLLTPRHRRRRPRTNAMARHPGRLAAAAGSRVSATLTTTLSTTRRPGKKSRAKAAANVRRLDPTVTPIAPLKQRDKVRAFGWERLDDAERLVPLDQEGHKRKLKAEARLLNKSASRREKNANGASAKNLV